VWIGGRPLRTAFPAAAKVLRLLCGLPAGDRAHRGGTERRNLLEPNRQIRAAAPEADVKRRTTRALARRAGV